MTKLLVTVYQNCHKDNKSSLCTSICLLKEHIGIITSQVVYDTKYHRQTLRRAYKKKKKLKKLNVKAQNPILLQQLARAKGGDIFSPQEYFQELHL